MFDKLKKRRTGKNIPKPTGRVIDFTSMRWGHNIEGAHPDEEGKWQAYCWLTPGPKVGDEVVWRTNYGLAYSIITEVRSCYNVDDMYYLHGIVTRREKDPS